MIEITPKSDSTNVQFSCSVMSDSSQPHGMPLARLPYPSLFTRVCSNSCPLNWGCHPAISSSVVPFSSCLWSFPESGSFLVSWLFTSSGQRIGASASVLPMNNQGWFPLGLLVWSPCCPRDFSRVFSNTTVRRYQFFSAQSFLLSSSHICTWLLEQPYYKYCIINPFN